MIRKILLYSLILLTGGIFSSCTQPDGYIGKWFGSWYLEEMLIEGEIDEQYAKYKEENTRQVMISFQSNVFNMAYLGSDQIFGTWSYAGEILTLNASWNSGSGYLSDLFDPFPIVLHFPKGVEVMEVTVTEFTGKKMQWQVIDPEGRLITYNFRKFP